jgi:hypothetical protein
LQIVTLIKTVYVCIQYTLLVFGTIRTDFIRWLGACSQGAKEEEWQMEYKSGDIVGLVVSALQI